MKTTDITAEGLLAVAVSKYVNVTLYGAKKRDTAGMAYILVSLAETVYGFSREEATALVSEMIQEERANRD